MIHCQSCTERNPLTREFCWKCGARLFVTSAASSGGNAMDGALPFLEEHVLERISSLESTLGTLNKRMDALVEMLERVAASNFIDHTMIETLTDSLETAGIDLKNLESDWRQRIDARIHESEAADRLGTRMRRVMEGYTGGDRKQFEAWIEQSYDLLSSGRGAESIPPLRAAFDQDRSNLELCLLLAEAYFQAREDQKSLVCLEQVLQTRPDDFEATLLVGLIQQRTGNYPEAERRLHRAVGLRNDSAAAHAALGSMLSRVGNRTLALEHLTAALKLKDSAPVHFLLGSVYRDGGENRRAIQHLRHATELDPTFGEAFYQLGLLCLQMNWPRKAQQCFKTAQTLNPGETRYNRRVQNFSEEAAGHDAPDPPDPLSGLIRDELQLVRYDNSAKRR